MNAPTDMKKKVKTMKNMDTNQKSQALGFEFPELRQKIINSIFKEEEGLYLFSFEVKSSKNLKKNMKF